ncbi:MAG: hypothetical protein ACYTBZ_31610, partial [Planctomycetota bacterium]
MINPSDMCQLAKAVFTGDEQLTGQLGFADPGDQRAIVGEREASGANLTGDEPADLTASGGDACDVILAAVFEIKIDVPSIFRKLEPRDVAIEVLGKEPGFAAVGIDHRKMVSGVMAAQDIGSRSICDGFAIGMPCRGSVGPRASCQLNQVLTLIGIIRIHEPYVGIIIRVGF